jgi:hypothetical protein
MHQPVVFERNALRDALAMKPGEQGCGAGSVEAFVVIKDFDPQPQLLLSMDSGITIPKAGRLRIMRATDCVKEQPVNILPQD